MSKIRNPFEYLDYEEDRDLIIAKAAVVTAGAAVRQAESMERIARVLSSLAAAHGWDPS